MNEKQLSEVCTEIGNKFLDLYAELCKTVPKPIVITAMTGVFAACTIEAGFNREKTINALNSAFDDIEQGQ